MVIYKGDGICKKLQNFSTIYPQLRQENQKKHTDMGCEYHSSNNRQGFQYLTPHSIECEHEDKEGYNV